jgi:sulfhydrogenase subunit beta (sulfur reductase)
MGAQRYIEQGQLADLLKQWSSEHRVLVPIEHGDAIVFRPFDGEGTLRLDRQPTAPPKDAIFPQTETLLRFTQRKDPEDLARTSIEIEQTIEAPKTVVFGSRPCGARGFATFDRVFDCDRIRDPYYASRRASTAFVSVVCTEPENTCFCTAVGGGPAHPEGSDVLLVPVDGGYVGQAVTEKGEALLALGPWSDAGDRAIQARDIAQQATAKMDLAFDADGVTEKVLRVSDNTEFWDDVAAKCIGCGACTYLCPTCYCFDITDESSGLCSKRIRTWDSCMSCSYTREASGHNPRPTQSHRLANRVAHKFGYYPSIHEGAISCTGCGRCIKSCPVAIDIRQAVIKAKEFKHA